MKERATMLGHGQKSEGMSVDGLRIQFRQQRFLLVIGTFACVGGAERQALMLAEFLKRNIGADVVFLGSESGSAIPARLNALKIRHSTLPFKERSVFPRKLADAARLVWAIRKLSPDYIIPFLTYSSKVLGLIWRLTGARYSLWNQRDEGRALTGGKFERLALRSVCSIVSNSHEGRDALVRKSGVAPERVTLINNGVIVPDVRTSDDAWRRRLDLKRETVIVCMIANLTPHKDHATLLRAWRMVEVDSAAKHREVALVLAGDTRDATDQLKVLAFDLRLRSLHMPGYVRDVHGLILESRLVVHSSVREGCPNAVLEAMAVGRTVVATDIPGIRQALGDAAAAKYCVQPKDATALASRITACLDDPMHTELQGRLNRERAKTLFGVAKMGESYLRLILRDCRGPTRGGEA